MPKVSGKREHFYPGFLSMHPRQYFGSCVPGPIVDKNYLPADV